MADRAQDALLAALAAALSLCLPVLDSSAAGELGPVWVLLVLGACAPLALRRRLPLTAAAASAGVVSIGVVLGQPQAGVVVALAAIGSAAYHREDRWPVLALGSAIWMLFNIVLAYEPLQPLDLLAVPGTAVAPVALGYALRLQKSRAEQLARLREAQVRQVWAEERAQLARDVHDVVGHHLSAIRMQAVGSRKALAGTEADAVLTTIATLSAEALQEIRRLLDDSEKPPDLEALVARLPGRIDVRGALPADLPRDVRHCAYRVVQEALTNVTRHSSAEEAEVRIADDEEHLVITVDDQGHGVPGPAGRGLRGMRERVESLGGSFAAGPREPRGWRVRARIPTRGGAR
ncbi:Signal transduction histidine kinase [Saccharopolyspora kobensis]|uniref:histidine kinase n=1 Tax=Saccharopolyspora kobensis TaxID=146035 RepID=A0A1H6E5P6_9PSEU|nr:Signal transduction histidine kinase [Saccharopolyspora kobensis]SFD36599.1 Signal transduction histidine kinase [Saccharopolyspora kobensis]